MLGVMSLFFNSSHSMSLKISKLCLLVMSDEFIQKTFSLYSLI